MGRRQRLRRVTPSHNLSYVKRFRRSSLAFWLGLLVALGSGAPAHALGGVPACPGVGETAVVVRDGGALESLAFDAGGRLVYDDLLSGSVRMLETPASTPRTLARLIAPGGIVPGADGALVVAQGNTIGRLIGGASLVELDPRTGARRPLAARLVGGNGVARAADGTLYASDVPAGVIDRIDPTGRVTRGWWRSAGGPNGLALTADGRTLYANLSSAGRVVAIDTLRGTSRTIARFAGPAAVPDGLAIDAAGRLYVALYLAGEVQRVDPATGEACRLARGLRLPTAIALAPPSGPFAGSSAYVTTSGAVRSIAGASPAG